MDFSNSLSQFWSNYGLGIISSVIFIGIILILAAFQWLGFKLLTKLSIGFWKLVGKSALGLIFLIVIPAFLSSNSEATTLNRHGLVVCLAINILIFTITCIAWIISISTWSKNFNFKLSSKASLFNLVLFSIPFFIYLTSLPTKKINELSVPELINSNEFEYVTNRDTSNADIIFNSIKNKELIFQYFDHSKFDSERLLVYKMPENFSINEYLKKLPENISKKELSDFLKCEINYGDSSSMEYGFFEPFFNSKKIVANGLNLMDFANHLRNNSIYDNGNDQRKFYIKKGIKNLTISVSNYTFLEAIYGKNKEYNTFDPGGYILQIFYDEDNDLLVLFKINKGSSNGP